MRAWKAVLFVLSVGALAFAGNASAALVWETGNFTVTGVASQQDNTYNVTGYVTVAETLTVSCSSGVIFIVSTSNDFSKKIYSTLLAAQLSGRQITDLVYDNQSGTCYLARARLV